MKYEFLMVFFCDSVEMREALAGSLLQWVYVHLLLLAVHECLCLNP